MSSKFLMHLIFNLFFNNLIVVLQNNSSHCTLNGVICVKQFLRSVVFESTTSCIRGKRLSARPQKPHGREHHGWLRSILDYWGKF